MTTIVRVFWHSGLSTAPVAAGTRYTTDSVALLKQSYVGRANLSVDSGTPAATDPAPAATKIAYVQVQSGKAVHIEINPENRSVAADTSSPILSGTTQFEAGPNWSISVLECTE